ncbi:sorting nexin-15 [Lissotriton helveticus]
MSRRVKEEYDRRYQVTGSRLNERGFTEYCVKAEFISKKNPQDVKEITVWKRYSDLKKLHSELSYTHRNLFRRMEEFPLFPKAQVFGRFEEAVIEERRKGAEAMLMFTVNIPALNNSPQLKDFFRGGEVKSRSGVLEAVEACGEEMLPPPLVPQPSAVKDLSDQSPKAASCKTAATAGVAEEIVQEQMAEKGTLSLEEPEEYGFIGRDSEGFGDLKDEIQQTEASEDLDLLFDYAEEEPISPTHCPLPDNELALFDPCCKDESAASASFHEEELASLVVSSELLNNLQLGVAAKNALWDEQLNPESETPNAELQEPGSYLTRATEQIKQALQKEGEEDYVGAIQSYRDGVDLLLKGVQGDTNAARKEVVKNKMAEYLKHAEGLYQLHLKENQP